ncbi:MAG: FAD-binding domain-containing protein, partial [Pseudomonadota bacterium]
VVWLKRDLRLLDHAPLAAAAADEETVVLFIYEPEILASPEFETSHLLFINACLAELARGLEARGARLQTRHGEATVVLDQLYEAWRFDRLLSHEETGTWATFERDRRVAAWCGRREVAWEEHRQHGVFRGLGRRDGWARRWRQHMALPIANAPDTLRSPDGLANPGIMTPADMGLGETTKPDAQPGGEAAAHGVLASFLDERGIAYATGMSSPVTAWDACSRLSAHFAWGSISLRQVYQATESRLAETLPRGWKRPLNAFGKRLRWHCHFIQKLESQPELEFENMSRSYDGLREDHWSDDRFEAWKAGRTGYPMVDACMRALRATGWINFRMRAMLVSFASYHLWLDWRPTSKWLGRHFLDFEPGIHYTQFQMQSGVTGINALRIYSPARQVSDQDPEGRFIRAWVPELEGVPDKYLPNPERMPAAIQQEAGCVIGRHYPEPIVEHAVAYKEARRRIGEIRGRPETRAEAQRVYDRHGSRLRPRPRVKQKAQGDLFASAEVLETDDHERA